MSTPARPLPEENLLHERLADLRRRWRFVVLSRGVSLTVAVVLLGTAVACAFDCWTPLPSLSRAVLLVGILAAASVCVYRMLLKPLAQRSDDLSLALRIEERFPHLNDSLASTIEFGQQEAVPSGESASFRREAVRRTLADIKECDFDQVIDRRGLRVAWGAAAVALVAALALIVIFPGTAMTAIARLAAPFGGSDWPRLTQIELEPVSSRIAQGDSFELRGKIKGAIPDNALILVRTENFPERRETVKLLRKDDHGRLFRRWNPTEITSSFRIKVLAGDAESPEFEVKVVPPPVLALLNGETSPQLRLDVPRYTLLPTPQVLPPGIGGVEIVPGTLITLRAAADRPLVQAWIDFVPRSSGKKPDASPPLPADGAALVATVMGVNTAPLSATGFLLAGETAWNRVYAVLDADRSRFTFRFAPHVDRIGLLTLRDDAGLQSAPREIDPRLYPDPAPVVQLERPAPQRDVLSVLPNAVLTLRLVAEDLPISEKLPVGALRAVYLEYRTAEDESPRRIPYFDAMDGLTAPRRFVYFASPHTGEPVTRLEIEAPLPIAQFKHRDGRPVRPGDFVLVRACAEDFDDVAVDKAPGMSPEVRLEIVDHSNLELNINRDKVVIQQALKDQRDREKAAAQQTRTVENRLKQNEPPTAADLDTLAQQEQVQREILDRFNGLRDGVKRLEESLKQNGMQNSPMRDQLRHVEKELKRLAENDLARAEQELDRARQEAGPAAQAADRAKEAQRGAADLNKQAQELIDKARAKEAEAGKNPGPLAKEKLLNEAKKERDQAAELKAKAAELEKQAAKAREEAAKLLKNSKAGEAVASARQRQEEVEKTLNDLLARLEPTNSVGDMKGEARDLTTQQRELEKRTAELEAKTRGKSLEELRKEGRLDELEELKSLREQQQALEERTQKLQERMKQEAEQRAKTEPELAQKLKDGARQIDKALAEMRNAKEKLGNNQLSEGRKDQRNAAAELENMARKLGRQSEAEQEQLVRKMRQAEQQIDKLRKEEEQLKKRMQELKDLKAKGELTEQQKQELKRLEARQEEIQQEAREMAKRLERDPRAERARQALEQAAKNPDEALERLNEAAREARQARKEEQEQLEREQLTRILEVIERLRDRQLELNVEGERIQKEVGDAAKWSRGLLGSMLGLGEGQSALKVEVDEIIPKELANTPVFARILQRSAEAMDLAAKRAKVLVDEGKKENAAVDNLPDAELRLHQRQALQRLEQIIEAVKSQLDTPPPSRREQQENNQEQPPEAAGSPPPQSGLPPLAQLKLLKTLQLDINKRSDDFQKNNPKLKNLTKAEQEEYNSIIRDQQDVRELLEEMRKAPAERAGEKPAEQKPPQQGEQKFEGDMR